MSAPSGSNLGFLVNGGSGYSVGTGSPWSVYTTTGGPVTDGVNGTPRTGAETRPVNLAINFIIKE